MRRLLWPIASLFLTGASGPPQERIVEPPALVAVRVNGVEAQLRIDPAAPAMPLLDRSLAERAKLKLTGSWGISIGYAVGSTSVMTRTQSVPFDFGDGAHKRRVGWATRSFGSVADGSIGPEALPERVIRFRLGPSRPGERTASFPMERDGALLGMFGNFSATFAQLDVGGEPLRVRFDPYHPRSLATAGAGARLARLYDGVVSGPSVPTEIFFGIQRPVRTLSLRRPFSLGPLVLTEVGLRTADYGRSTRIPEANAPPEPADPDEVVVTARDKKRDARRDTISLGADYLQRCSSLVFDRPASRILLTCA